MPLFSFGFVFIFIFQYVQPSSFGDPRQQALHLGPGDLGKLPSQAFLLNRPNSIQKDVKICVGLKSTKAKYKRLVMLVR